VPGIRTGQSDRQFLAQLLSFLAVSQITFLIFPSNNKGFYATAHFHSRAPALRMHFPAPKDRSVSEADLWKIRSEGFPADGQIATKLTGLFSADQTRSV